MSFLKDYYTQVNEFYLTFINRKKKHIINSFTSSFPKSVAHVRIDSKDRLLLNISLHFKGIIRISSRVLNEIDISSFRISQPQLKRFIVFYKHVQAIRFYSCKLSVSVVMDFTDLLKNTNIQILSFCYSAIPKHDHWETDLNEFINLIKSLATSKDLKKMLKYLSLTKSMAEPSEARKILDQNGFDKVEATYPYNKVPK
ncbi:unnamed protein product [Moneuplotes crassus]|uniref:Uncharacterized protein n=1 Tax=Euplotes crassus TaxID=5936 RepID=A0AAD1UI05_EUPCR|nr:unnamed protein product [Moneuplotes crassus]